MASKKTSFPKQDIRVLLLDQGMHSLVHAHAARQQLHTLNLEQQAMLDNDLIGIAKVKDRVIVWRNPELSMSVPVRPDGKVAAPLVDARRLTGGRDLKVGAFGRADGGGFVRRTSSGLVDYAPPASRRRGTAADAAR